MNIKWLRGKPVLIILLFAILILFLSVVIILAGQQGSYLKTSSTGGINPDDFLNDCWEMSGYTHGQCLYNAKSEYETCTTNYPYKDDPFEPNLTPPPVSQVEWTNQCLEMRDDVISNCDETRKADDEECERIANGLKGTPTPDPTPAENPIEQAGNTPNPTP